jgi:hypothetical protein
MREMRQVFNLGAEVPAADQLWFFSLRRTLSNSVNGKKTNINTA